ncbi:hypothetical protein DEJ25_09765 [Curtobacterium sp. MCPF17_011]|uniref:hypothetical protein n=1 Tax=Curtobacterium sp. MCPF17_011 TaxID=2175652 RepID=UPI000DAA07DC|nr:hypothetical protein [Curtobacterium sp. MCPF17_011]PZF12103.1 hypothetical protein DEJ25_09765 [Curtobacterium sp. MCPF17_011]
MASLSDVKLGQTWAYRTALDSAQFHEAVVLTVGDKRPPRVRIELVDDQWQGERRWVSPARLEALWDDRHEYIELDRKFQAIRKEWVSSGDLHVVEHIFLRLVPMQLAEFNCDRAGTTVVLDVPGLAAHLGVTQEELRASPGFVHDQVLHVPWTTTTFIARTAAQRWPHRLLGEIETEERQLAEDSINGTTVTDWDGNDHNLSPDEARAQFEKHRRPYLDKLREYIGVERADTLLERRDLLRRLGQAASVAGRALDVLEPTQKRIVAKLREELEGALDGVDFLPPSGPTP